MKKIGAAIAGYLRTIDKWLIILWGGASAASILFLYGLYVTDFAKSDTVVKQVIAIGIGVFAAFFISLFDYHTILKLWKLFFPLCLFLVLLTFVLGDSGRNDEAWLIIPLGFSSFSLQPSELLKISFILTMAIHLDKIHENINSIPNVFSLLVHGGFHVILIHLQDSGSALVFVFIFVIMVFFAGISWKYIAGAFTALIPAVYVIWFYIMDPYQQMRFKILWDPDLDAAYAYQQARGRLALGVGGIQGTGLFSGGHVYVPEIYNDFIFAFVGESMGFMGCLGVIALLTAICLKLLYNSSLAADNHGRLIFIGIFAMIFSQTVINLGMCTSILPVVGVTLPLFSSGGTSAIALYMSLGIALSVYRHSATGLFFTDKGMKKI